MGVLNVLEVGQLLWWVDHNTATEGTVTVTSVEKSQFAVLYQGRTYVRPYSALGTKLFYTSQLPKREITTVKACSNCFLRYSGECTSLRNELCEDYRAKQTITKVEMDEWPTHGDATAFRIKKRKPIKKEKW